MLFILFPNFGQILKHCVPDSLSHIFDFHILMFFFVLQKLNSMSPKLDLKQCDAAVETENVNKNRYHDILARKYHMSSLTLSCLTFPFINCHLGAVKLVPLIILRNTAYICRKCKKEL